VATPVVPACATIAELLLARAADDNTALLFEDQRWSWRELVQEAATRSALLQQVRPPDRPWHAGVLLENTPEYVFLTAGAALCGATVVGINPTRRGAELAADISGTDCAMIVTDDAYGGLLDGIGHGVPQILDAGGSEYAGLLAGHREAPVEATPEGLDPRSTLLLLFTSGSTGAPKAVICSTGRWAFICQITPLRFTAADVAYNAMPIFHGNALMSSLGPCLANGAAFAMRRRFSASGFLPDIRRFGATFFNYVGRSLAYVLAQPARPEEAERLVRITASLPLTATHKIGKPTLRRLLWSGEDPVYEHTDDGYVLMSADRKPPSKPNTQRTAGTISCGSDRPAEPLTRSI
jgi:steroid-22-oyl-CoA synthetase